MVTGIRRLCAGILLALGSFLNIIQPIYAGNPTDPFTYLAADSMDDTLGGKMRDNAAIGLGHDGTLHNILLVPNCVGSILPCYRFNGTVSSVIIPGSPYLQAGDDALLVQIDVQPNRKSRPAAGKTYNIVRNGFAAEAGAFWKIALGHDGKVRVSIRGSAAGALTPVISLGGGPVLDDGKFHGIQLLKWDNLVQIFIDNKLVAQRVALVGTLSNGAPIVLGRSGYRGRMDNLYISAQRTIIPASGS